MPCSATSLPSRVTGSAMLWFDGTIQASTQVPFNVADRGLLIGDGIFDTSLVLYRRIFRIDDHLARLGKALAALGISIDLAVVRGAMAAMAERGGEGALRVTVTRGPGPR